MKWFNIRGRSDCTFQFFVGGRGIGKTYSALLSHYKDWKAGKAGKICYMRLTQTEIEQSAVKVGNPYKTINRDNGYDIRFEAAGKKLYNIYDTAPGENDAETLEQMGVGVSLSSLGSLRGVDFGDVSEIYFDEFIPAESVVKTPAIKNAGRLFFNAYETINRNRELLGEQPVKCYFTANAFSLDSDILNKFKCIDALQHMQEHGQKRYTDPKRSIYIEICDAPEVAAAKMQTALYKAIDADDEFLTMAIQNKFSDYVLTLLKTPVIMEYRPIMAYKNIVIYQHKSNGTLYAAKRKDTVPPGCAYDEKSRGIFIKAFYFDYKTALQMRQIYFDSAETKQALDKALDKLVKL